MRTVALETDPKPASRIKVEIMCSEADSPKSVGHSVKVLGTFIQNTDWTLQFVFTNLLFGCVSFLERFLLYRLSLVRQHNSSAMAKSKSISLS
jgi:hypothetical protein